MKYKIIIPFLLLILFPGISLFSEEKLFWGEKVAMAEVVQVTANGLSSLIKGFEEEDKKLEIIRDFIEDIRFLSDRSGYFYIYNYEGICMAHPIQKDLIGNNLYDYRDSNGKYIIRALINTAKTGGGFIDFRWQKPDGTPDRQKLGYVFPIEGTDYLIGSGVYMPDKHPIIAFAYAKPPFVFSAPPFKYEDYDISSKRAGIEQDLVTAALRDQNYSYTPVFLSYNELESGLKNGFIEIAATVRNTLPDIYYSEEFVYFHNIAISKKKNNLEINSLEDLADLSIVAWEGASKDLGTDFENSIKDNADYNEIGNQEKQGKAFFNDDAEVIIIDKTIFEWWLGEFSDRFNTKEEYVYHDLFPDKTVFYIGFKSKEIRDIFNKGLRNIRESGIYDQIINSYKGPGPLVINHIDGSI